jgi:hypothetical protein
MAMHSAMKTSTIRIALIVPALMKRLICENRSAVMLLRNWLLRGLVFFENHIYLT